MGKEINEFSQFTKYVYCIIIIFISTLQSVVISSCLPFVAVSTSPNPIHRTPLYFKMKQIKKKCTYGGNFLILVP